MMWAADAPMALHEEVSGRVVSPIGVALEHRVESILIVTADGRNDRDTV